MLLIRIVCVGIFLNTLSSRAYTQDVKPSDVTNMLNRLRSMLTQTTPDSNLVSSLMRSVQQDGSWKDIDYWDMRVSSWPAIRHLGNVSNFANAYSNKKSSFYKNEKLEKVLHLSLNYWLKHNFTNENWWWNDVGVPETLANILIVMDGSFTQDELLRALNQMRGSYIRQTGQNKIWRAEIQLKIGLLGFGRNVQTNYLEPSEDHIRNSIAILKEQIEVGGEEGIQPDWSFHQHGIQQQFGNYGLSYANTQTEWAWVLAETLFKYNQAELDILRNYVLNGLSTVVFKEMMDISACGRQLYPGYPAMKGKQVIRILELLSQIDPQNVETYSSYINCLQGIKGTTYTIPQTTYFWNSDLMVHKTSDFYISVRMHSKIVQSTESGAGDNLQGAYLADGATYVSRTGKEYENIFPTWNWHRIPGTTSYTQKKIPVVNWNGLRNESNFVGGVSKTGVATMLFKRDGLSAYKSWFSFPNGVLCLGAGIHSLENTNVSTTINQSLLKGNISLGSNRVNTTISMVGQSSNRKDVDWVLHDSIGYVFLKKSKIHVSADKQSGRWNLVYNQGSTEPVSNSIFNLWIDHGNDPISDSYAYMILPAIGLDSVKYFSKHPPFEILQNDTSVQAVQYAAKGVTQIVFFHAGKISLDKLTTLWVNTPCILVAQQHEQGYELTVATPPADSVQGILLDVNGHLDKKGEIENVYSQLLGSSVTVTMNGQYSGDDCNYNAIDAKSRIIFKLPGGISTGKSVTKVIQVKNLK